MTFASFFFYREGDLRVIRPFVNVRETQTREFAEKNKLPVIPENCPACYEAPKVNKFLFLLASTFYNFE